MNRLTSSIAIMIIALAGCAKNETIKSGDISLSTPKDNSYLAVSTVADFNLVTTNQANNKIEVYDNASTDWNATSALLWSWKPATTFGYTTAEVAAWTEPSGVKRRTNDVWGGEWIVATASGGLATIASYNGTASGSTKKWAKKISGNPHDAELLPNGNIAIASSTDATGPQHIVGSIRIYASSQGATSYDSCHFELKDAHGLLWDPALNRLWVLGKINSTGESILTTLVVGGTDAHPTLTEDSSHRITLPTPNGHCLAAFYGDTNKLWVSSGGEVYIFDKAAKHFSKAPGLINKVGVKAISNQPSGIVVLTRPDGLKKDNLNPPLDPSTLHDWTTSYVDFYSASGDYLSSGHRVGVSWYKGMVWWAHYQ